MRSFPSRGAAVRQRTIPAASAQRRSERPNRERRDRTTRLHRPKRCRRAALKHRFRAFLSEPHHYTSATPGATRDARRARMFYSAETQPIYLVCFICFTRDRSCQASTLSSGLIRRAARRAASRNVRAYRPPICPSSDPSELTVRADSNPPALAIGVVRRTPCAYAPRGTRRPPALTRCAAPNPPALLRMPQRTCLPIAPQPPGSRQTPPGWQPRRSPSDARTSDRRISGPPR